MAIYEHDSDIVRWGLRLLSVEDDPFLNYGYSGNEMHRREPYVAPYNVDSNYVENDEMIARALQDEFARLDMVDSRSGEDHDSPESSGFLDSWQSPPRNYSPERDYSLQEDNIVDQDEYMHGLELGEDYANDDEVFSKFDSITPIPHVPKINGEIPSIDEATSDHQRLLDRLESFGFVERQVEGDGNCQFHSLSDQLYGTPENHKDVRREIVNQLKSQPEIYEGYVPMEYADYMERMSMNGEWGDHVTLQAAADAYALKIIVLTSFKDTYCIEILPKLQKPKRVICLSFWAEVHYNSIYPQGAPDAPSAESRKKRRWWSFRS